MKQMTVLVKLSNILCTQFQRSFRRLLPSIQFATLNLDCCLPLGLRGSLQVDPADLVNGTGRKQNESRSSQALRTEEEATSKHTAYNTCA